jgi:hypothetical protein
MHASHAAVLLCTGYLLDWIGCATLSFPVLQHGRSGIVANRLWGDLEAGAIAPVMPGMQITLQRLGCMRSGCIEPGSFSWGLLDAPLVKGPDLVRLIDYEVASTSRCYAVNALCYNATQLDPTRPAKRPLRFEPAREQANASFTRTPAYCIPAYNH